MLSRSRIALAIVLAACLTACLTPKTSTAYIWADPTRLATLDTTGALQDEWKQISATARVLLGKGNVSGSLVTDTIPNLNQGQGDRAHVMVLAKAIYYARTGNALFKNEAERILMRAIGSERSPNARTLDLGRYLPGYCMAYDIIGGLSAGNDTTWTRWLYNTVLAKGWSSSPEDGSLRGTARFRANNWGAFSVSAITAAGCLLDQKGVYADSAAAWKALGWEMYQDYCGRFPAQIMNYSTSAGFKTSDSPASSDQRSELYAPKVIRAASPTWDSLRPINPACLLTPDEDNIERNLDGAIIDDMSRTEDANASGVPWPLATNAAASGAHYMQDSWVAMVVTAEILFNSGYTTAWSVQNEAVRRVTDCLWRLANDVQGPGGDHWWPDDVIPEGEGHQAGYVIPLINKRYGTSYPWNQPSGCGAPSCSAGPGGFISGRWVAWTHQ